MFKHKLTRRGAVRLLSFGTAALIALSLFSAVCWGHLTLYRRQTAVDADRAFEETVGALNDLSEALEKSRYAMDGPMCARVCAEIYADAGRAGTALSALPFSTVEMEQLKRFISLSGDYAYTLCREAAERGFLEDERANMLTLSATASELAGNLSEMHAQLRDGALTMDSREAQVANIVDSMPDYLSERLGAYAGDFPETQALRYRGQYTAREPERSDPTDEAQAREQAAALLACAPEALSMAGREENGARLLFTEGSRTVTVTAAGVETLRDGRIVSERNLDEQAAKKAAEEALRALGYEGLRWESSETEGNVLRLTGSAETDGVTGLDREITLSVALDDGSLCALDLSRAAGESAQSEWLYDEALAREAVPPGLHLRRVRRVTVAGPDGTSLACYELQCLDDEAKRVSIFLNADTGKQEEISIG